ncbi:tetratricopeptide repeat protein [Methanobacterium sp.]|uniref:tetratricopeptide repeat protein n=1 Tax=Methanobacterium sp. TaxID=2164 RepID=UPI002AB8FE5B|nr:tetratricopeptide repeat protein [Methanobacterium sp.]MDY9922535.1 tetratricopeptide repeat protein [Methanobacterium sp.]
MAIKEAEMFYKQAMSFLEQGKLDKSIEFFDSALKIDKDYISAWNDKGVALMELGKYPEALQCFEEVIRLEPGDNMAWYNRGYVLLIMEEYQEAVNTFDLFRGRYSKKDDFYKYALYLQAQGLYNLKEYDESLKLIKESLKMDKTFKEARDLMELVGKETSKKE